MAKRETVDVPDELREWVEDTFGPVSNSRSEMYRHALAYAKRQWELEEARADRDSG